MIIPNVVFKSKAELLNLSPATMATFKEIETNENGCITNDNT